MDYQEEQKRKQDIKREKEALDRRIATDRRNGIQSSEVSTPAPASQSTASAGGPTLPVSDFAIEVSLGKSVQVSRHPTYTRRGVVINDQNEEPLKEKAEAGEKIAP